MRNEGHKLGRNALLGCGLAIVAMLLACGLKADQFAARPLEKLIEPNAPALGPENAKVVLVEYSDFQCPFCSRMSVNLNKLQAAHPGQIRLIWMDRPLIEEMGDGFSFHPFAMIAHEAAAEAQTQGKFWEIQKFIFAHQGDLFRLPRPSSQKELSEALKKIHAQLVAAAGELGLDKDKMDQALTDHRHRETIMKRLRKAQGLGIDGTPTVYVNGRDMDSDFDVIKKEVEKLLKESSQ